MRILPVVLVLLLVSSTVAPAQLSANEPPLADAGLDQTVARGATVYLDASGSRDPDGDIESFEWLIETPDNGTTTPVCPRCARTRFTPDQVGRYEVTVIVTDDDGATARDTLYVDVEPGDPPSISVAGPTGPSAGTSVSYVATVDSGTASLSEVTWRVGDRVVRTESTSGEHSRVNFPYSFESPGRHVVTATVTDADGLTASDSITVQVTPSEVGGGNQSPGDNGSRVGRGGPGVGGDPGDVPSSARRFSPEVRGPQVLTGTGPFSDQYWVEVNSTAVESVSWWRDGERAASGRFASLSWTPGIHYLYAVVEYVDGSTETARFASGSTTVEVDPEPTVELTSSSGFGSLTGLLRAEDAFGNLREVSVRVDGKLVASKTVDPVRLRSGDGGARLDLSFNYTDITPGGTHRVALHARDSRGQSVVHVETIDAVGEPEIVFSEFVNGPVDSYHPRLDPERYTAHHVLKIDLNGVDLSQIKVVQSPKLTPLGRLSSTKEVIGEGENSTLVISSRWYGDEPRKYKVESYLIVKFGLDIVQSKETSEFIVEPSPPEVRVDVRSDGTPDDDKQNWGIVVDASRSFDPDGTELKYIWGGGAEAISKDSAVAKFDSLDLNGLTVEDGDNQTTTVPVYGFIRHYSPPVESVTELTEGPYKPNETVRFAINTTEFKLPKQTYYKHTPIGIRIRGRQGTVTRWGCRVVGPFDEAIVDKHSWDCQIAGNATDPDRRGSHFYRGTISFEASDLAEGNSPEIYVYNINKPNQSARSISLPDVEVLEKGKRYVSDVEVLNTSYLVEKPIDARREVALESQRDAYLSEGFSIEHTELSGTKYTLEKRVKTQEAKYEARTRTFDSRGHLNSFLAVNPEWEQGETTSELRNWTTTEYEWRSERGGPGAFTGATRRVKVDDADYRTERQYRHEYTVERTGTRTVTRRRTIRIPITRYRTKTICNRFGCYAARVSYTQWVTRTRTYTTTETYTYTTREVTTYWSVGRRHPGDSFTGRTRRIKIDEADYETQYQFSYQKHHEEWVWHYTARRDVLVQPAEYEWQPYRTTKSDVVAETAEATSNRRIGHTEPAKIWILTKRTGTERIWKASVVDPQDVVKTKAAVNETISQMYIRPSGGDAITEQDEIRVVEYVFKGYLDRESVKTRRIYEVVEENN